MKRKVALTVAIAAFWFAASLPALAGGLVKATSKNAEAQKLIDQAWALEKTDTTIEIMKQCIAGMEQADKLDPNHPAILVDLSRYYWQSGDLQPKQTEEQKKSLEALYAKGLDAAEKSLKLKETSGAHYWCAVNKAASLEFSSILLQAAAFPSIYSHYQYVAKNDPDYDYGASARLWSEILSRVPKKVVEIVGPKYVDEVMTEMDRCLKAEPRYLQNYLYKARFMYVYFENKEEALKLLDAIMKADPNALPDEALGNRLAQRDGKLLWKKITGKEYPER